jgi:hypothetical protein
MVANAGFRTSGMTMVLLTLALAAVALALLAPAADARQGRYPTSSSFGYYAGNAVVFDAFLGQVSSSEPACTRGRKATVFRKREGRDPRVGSDRASSTGQWIVEKRRVRRGRYYLKIKAKRLSARHKCRAYRSSTLPMGG